MKKTFSQRLEAYWSKFPSDDARSLGADLLKIIIKKKTNLCVSCDIQNSEEFLRTIDQLGPYVCMIKTHIDIVDGFDRNVAKNLVLLSQKYEFLIFEDRKFADIGNTAFMQYTGGVFKIRDWAPIVNAHCIVGDGLIKGLKDAGLKPEAATDLDKNEYLDNRARACLLLAEMSSSGSLLSGELTDKCVEMALRHRDFILGFVASRRLVDLNETGTEDFLTFTPGIKLEAANNESFGQTYRTPEYIITELGSDIAIVGRGIISGPKEKLVSRAITYRDRCWAAYESRVKS